MCSIAKLLNPSWVTYKPKLQSRVKWSHSFTPTSWCLLSLSVMIMLENCTHQTSLLQTVVLHSETVCTLPQMNRNVGLTNFEVFSCFQVLFQRILKLLLNSKDVEQHMFQRWKTRDDMSYKAQHNMASTDVLCYYMTCTTIVEGLTITHLEQGKHCGCTLIGGR